MRISVSQPFSSFWVLTKVIHCTTLWFEAALQDGVAGYSSLSSQHKLYLHNGLRMLVATQFRVSADCNMFFILYVSVVSVCCHMEIYF